MRHKYTLTKVTGRDIWYFYWYDNQGKRHRRSTGTSVKHEADDVARKYVSQPPRQQPTLREYCEPFFKIESDPRVRRKLDEQKTVGLEHLQKSRRWLERFVLEDPIAHRKFAEIRRRDVLAFRSRLVAKLGERRNTTNKVMATLKTVFKEALYLEDIDTDPTMGIGAIKETRRPPGVLTADELKKLFPPSGLGPWRDDLGFCCFLMAATTGMRRGEILALKWRNVNLTGAWIHVAEAYKRVEKTDGAPKSGKPRDTPIPSALVDALARLQEDTVRLHPTDYVFCHEDTGAHMGETWWRDRFRAAMEKAEIDWSGRNITPHSLRHSLATLLEAEDYNPRKIRAALGWSGEGIRENYTHLGAEHLKEQAEIVDRLLGE